MLCCIHDDVKLLTKNLNDVPMLRNDRAEHLSAHMLLAGQHQQQKKAASSSADDTCGPAVSVFVHCWMSLVFEEL